MLEGSAAWYKPPEHPLVEALIGWSIAIGLIVAGVLYGLWRVLTHPLFLAWIGTALFVANLTMLVLVEGTPLSFRCQGVLVGRMFLGELLMMIGWVLIPVLRIRRRSRLPINGCEVTQ